MAQYLIYVYWLYLITCMGKLMTLFSCYALNIILIH